MYDHYLLYNGINIYTILIYFKSIKITEFYIFHVRQNGWNDFYETFKLVVKVDSNQIRVFLSNTFIGLERPYCSRFKTKHFFIGKVQQTV